MIYDGSKNIDRQRAKERLEWLFEKGKVFEITEKRQRRSISQNSYLHLILGWYAWEYGETMAYVKSEVFKKQVNREIFLTDHINKKTGEVRDDWRSTADLDTLELTTAIDRFRDYASKEAGIYLPEPSDMASMNALEMELLKNSKNV